MYLHYVHTSSSPTLTERALPLGVKGVAEELWTKGNVGEIVLVLDRAEQVHSPSGGAGREGCQRKMVGLTWSWSSAYRLWRQ